MSRTSLQKALKEERLEQTFELSDLSIATGIPISSLVSFEHGIQEIDSDALQKICTFLGVCPMDMIHRGLPEPSFCEKFLFNVA